MSPSITPSDKTPTRKRKRISLNKPPRSDDTNASAISAQSSDIDDDTNLDTNDTPASSDNKRRVMKRRKSNSSSADDDKTPAPKPKKRTSSGTGKKKSPARTPRATPRNRTPSKSSLFNFNSPEEEKKFDKGYQSEIQKLKAYFERIDQKKLNVESQEE